MTATNDDGTRRPSREVADHSVGSPTAFPGAAIAGALLGVVLLACCGLLIRDLLAAAGALKGGTWVHRAAENLGSQEWSDWMWVIPAACAVVGLAALWLAVKPRHRTHVNVADDPVIWTRPVDVARRVSAAVSDLPDVRRAVTVIGRRRVKVQVTAVGPVDTERVTDVARAAIDSSAVAGKVVVKVKTGVSS